MRTGRETDNALRNIVRSLSEYASQIGDAYVVDWAITPLSTQTLLEPGRLSAAKKSALYCI